MQKTEELLWNFITAPEGVQKAIEGHSDADLPIRPSTSLSPVERLDIYANMYFYRILDSLREDFPAVSKITGDAGFHSLITDYLIPHPSTSYTLRNAGKNLPEFLKTHPLGGKYPFLPDLACLEWLLIESFDAPDNPVLSATGLKAIPPDQWPRLIFKFVDSCHLMESGWPVGEIHRKVKERGKIGPVKPSPNKLRIWRREFKVYTRLVDDEEYALLKQIERGKPFGDLCQVYVRKTGFKKAVQTAAAKLSGWLKEELFQSTLKTDGG
ncbi:MAG: putative DNA-binding domain-containing protein [Deltaproteobacteria bacterium]|nr:putative DNA-binding domain-containing protein [Deltaproteobacteria bacterium]